MTTASITNCAVPVGSSKAIVEAHRGTITLAAYGYWLREKGWNTPGHMRVMRIDNSVAYAVTGLFVVATLIVCGGLIISLSLGIRSAMGLFIKPMSADLALGREIFGFGFYSGRVTAPTPFSICGKSP